MFEYLALSELIKTSPHFIPPDIPNSFQNNTTHVPILKQTKAVRNLAQPVF